MLAIKRTLWFINSHPFARRHKLRAFKKFLSWQIKSRFRPELIEMPFIEETKVWAKRGLTGITGNFYTGLHEFSDMGFLLHFLRQSDVFFDVGANVGAYTVLASGVKKAKSIAFEPISTTFRILQKNISLNNLEDIVTAENLGVGGSSGILRFTDGQDTTNHILAEDEADFRSIKVPITTLDDYILNFSPALIKIDVEGFETEVLSGAKKVLENPTLKAIIIELNGSGARYGFDERDIHEKLRALNFDTYSYDPFSRSLTKLETFGSLNTIYIRDFSFVDDRVKSSTKFQVFNESI